MRYVPSLPLPVSPLDTEGRKQVDPARAVRPVTTPVVPPIVITHYRHTGEADAGARSAPPRLERRSVAERRNLCRRFVRGRDKLPLLNSRAGLERRRNNRRQADFRTNVDEEI